MYLDQKLSFKPHVKFIASKLSKSIGIINKIKFLIPKHCLNLLYNSLCMPYLTYGNIVWANAYPSTTNPIKLLMKRAIRTITLSNKFEHTENLFKGSNNLNFHQLNRYWISIFVFKQLNNKLPAFFKFYYSQNTNFRRTNNILCNRSRTNILFLHVFCSGPKIWNDLLNDGFKLMTNVLTLFKKQLKNFLVNQN